jgi:hypothetical protein
MKTRTRRDVLLLAGLTLVSVGAARAETPAGPVILTVKGKIGGSDSGTSEFDLAMLEALPKTSFKTSSPWTEAGTSFDGVSLKDLAQAVGAKGTKVTARALNDYASSFPLDEAAASGCIVAYRMNGEVMTPRDKGPLWIIYPFDDRPELKTETNYSHCVWQLAVIEFTD